MGASSVSFKKKSDDASFAFTHILTTIVVEKSGLMIFLYKNLFLTQKHIENI